MADFKGIMQKIGDFKLKSLIPFIIGALFGYIFHEWAHDAITIDQIKELLDYIVMTWKNLTS